MNRWEVPDVNPSPSVKELFEGQSIILIGCGRMGSALFEGWIAAGLKPASIFVLDPYIAKPMSARIKQAGATINHLNLPTVDTVLVIAIKPQLISKVLPSLSNFADRNLLFISIAAGVPIKRIGNLLGGGRVVRAMPNTPASIGVGITALVPADQVDQADRDRATALMQAVGEVLWLEDESGMDAVTAVSGSGPAYVFYLIETLAAAGEAEGLSPELALALARATVAGAGALAEQSPRPPSELRNDVTGPGGTTAAGLVELMDAEKGLLPVMLRTVKAAAERSRYLGSS